MWGLRPLPGVEAAPAGAQPRTAAAKTPIALAADGAASNRASSGPSVAAERLVTNHGGVGQALNGARQHRNPE